MQTGRLHAPSKNNSNTIENWSVEVQKTVRPSDRLKTVSHKQMGRVQRSQTQVDGCIFHRWQ